MKLKRIFGGVVALAMAGAMALSVSASADNITVNAAANSVTVSPIGAHPNDTRIGVVIAGEGDDLPAGISHVFLDYGVNFEDIRTARISLYVPADAVGEDGEPAAVGDVEFITWGSDDFQQRGVSEGGADIDVSPSTGTDHFSFTITNWYPGTYTQATIQFLDAAGNVIALNATDPGTGAGDDTATTTAATTAAATTATGGTGTGAGKAPVTGVTGIAILGGVAVLAAGAIVISRRNK